MVFENKCVNRFCEYVITLKIHTHFRESVNSLGQSYFSLGYWHQMADERHGNPPLGNQELLVVRDIVGRPPGELGVSKSTECDIFSFNALTLLVGRQEGHPACKNWMLVCLW